MMKEETLYIVLPAYNEEENIRKVVVEWYPHIADKSDDSKMVIADGGSKDNTLNILYELQKEYPKLEVFSKPNTDHGTKVIFLYDYAIKSGADYIFQTDSDRQTDPAEFPQFWASRDQFDAVIGNRTKRGDGYGRKFVEDVLRLLLFIYFNAKTPDSGAPFRLMRTSLVKKYLYLMPSDYNLPNAFLTACFARDKENVKYIPITFKNRQGGKNYIDIGKIFKIGLQSLKNFFMLRKRLRAEGL